MAGSDVYEEYIRDFLNKMFPSGDVPLWAVDALAHAQIGITTTLVRGEAGKGVDVKTDDRDGDADDVDGIS